MEKSAKRISSIFSLSSTSTDKRNSNPNVPPSSLHAPRDSRTPSPSRLLQNSITILQPSASSPNLRTPGSGQSPHLNPSVDPIRSTSTISNNTLPPGVLKHLPLPQGSFRNDRPQSAASSRPSSSSRNFSRPTSSDGSRPASPSRDFYRPIAPISETGETSRPASRAGLSPTSSPTSPAKHLSRPATPTTEKGLSKRRCWLPGRSKHGSTEEADGAHAPPRAWVVTWEQQIPYDVSPLLSFQKVSDTTTLMPTKY